MKVAGAIGGRFNREMLSRIYGTAFAKQEQLEAYLKQIEEVEKRDHRKPAERWICFISRRRHRARCSGIKGWMLFQILESYIRRRQTEAGYVESTRLS